MKILISRPDKIGDVILALHAAKQLKEVLPESEVYLHVSDYTYPLVRQIGFLDGVVKLTDDLKIHQFDAVVDLMAKPWTAKMYWRAEIPVRIGNGARWFSFLYTKTTFLRRSYARMNEAEYNWRLISLLDPTLHGTGLESCLNSKDFREVPEKSENVESDKTRPIVLMPGVSASALPWGVEHWIELAKMVAARGNEVVILGGPAEEQLLAQITPALSDQPKIEVKLLTDFGKVLALLNRAAGYVGPSTGITHLAGVAGTPGIAIYPPQRSMHPRRWRPFRSKLRILSLTPELSAAHVYNNLCNVAFNERLESRRPPVSGFIICCNEERKIRRALESMKWCDELFIIDSGSTDRTLDICREYTDRIVQREWPGHRKQKQFALENCSHEWVLNIDADEELSDELRLEIERALARDGQPKFETKGYLIPRVVYFMGIWWDRGGWHPEYRMRLMRKSSAHWGGVDPHEKAIVNGKVERLKAPIYHYTYSDITDQVSALNRLSTHSAHCLYQQGKKARLANLFFNPAMRFVKFYFLKRGFLEGRAGFIVACNEAFYTFMKYIKLWELSRGDPTLKVACNQSSSISEQVSRSKSK